MSSYLGLLAYALLGALVGLAVAVAAGAYCCLVVCVRLWALAVHAARRAFGLPCLVALMMTCRYATDAGPGRPPIDTYEYFQISDAGVTYHNGRISFDTEAGDWYSAGRDIDCVIEEGTAPSAQDERDEEDRQ